MINSDKNNVKNYDLVIVGGGMVGISLALLLAQQQSDWNVLLLEAQAYDNSDNHNNHPSFDSRSTALSWSSRKIFQAAGLWSELESHTSAIKNIHVSDRGHIGLTRISADEAGVDALGYVVENRWIGNVLLKKFTATAVEIMAPERVGKITPLKSGVRLNLEKSGEAIETSLLVIADGANSQTAQKLGIHSDKKPYGQQGIIANIALQDAHNGVAYERFTDQGPMAMLPLPDFDGSPRCALVWTQPPERAAELMTATDKDFLKALQESFGYRMGMVEKVGERVAYPLALTTASEQVRRNIVVLGNAAHSLHPVAGQGFNLSLRDVATLADVLGKAKSAGTDFSSLETLERYQQQQLADQQNTLMFSDNLPKLFAQASSVVALGRNSGLVMMDLLPSLRSRFAKFGMGMANKEAGHGA
ncbi:2-octaprenyl-6-methoxyphenyl hydroxylase [bacterium]|nr:2-octaprenyl-6-methoxyphenyl hydroxylase [Porticoccaceae bacterium]MDC0589049.1 2-octaprenyl-6-methoxyphenyl hydroxylase [Porticoccaceae bacterium]MDC3261258.1 2-octaprenyl-6-methoxyphenyl hydroxylase [bacterium]